MLHHSHSQAAKKLLEIKTEHHETIQKSSSGRKKRRLESDLGSSESSCSIVDRVINPKCWPEHCGQGDQSECVDEASGMQKLGVADFLGIWLLFVLTTVIILGWYGAERWWSDRDQLKFRTFSSKWDAEISEFS